MSLIVNQIKSFEQVGSLFIARLPSHFRPDARRQDAIVFHTILACLFGLSRCERWRRQGTTGLFDRLARFVQVGARSAIGYGRACLCRGFAVKCRDRTFQSNDHTRYMALAVIMPSSS